MPAERGEQVGDEEDQAGEVRACQFVAVCFCLFYFHGHCKAGFDINSNAPLAQLVEQLTLNPSLCFPDIISISCKF